jgi:hypothetical protein
VPSDARPFWLPLTFIPFSICRLPAGTTMLELVTSGRSVDISSRAVGHPAAFASAGLRQMRAVSDKTVRFHAGLAFDFTFCTVPVAI